MIWPFQTKSAPAEDPPPSTSGTAFPEQWFLELLSGGTGPSGVSVTPTSAMRVPAVRAAVLAISEAVGQLPLALYDRRSREKLADHPLYTLLHDRANEAIGAGEMREMLTRDALLTGNGFAHIVRVGGEPRELLRMDPAAVQVEPDEHGLPAYRLTGNRPRVLARRDVLHLRGPGTGGVKGDSPVRQAREAIGLAILLETHAAKLFAQGARPAGAIEVPVEVKADGLRKILDAWRLTHEGSQNSGKTAILPSGAKFNPITFSSVDAQFLELRQYAVSEIARVFRVPPVFVQDYGRATWSNSAEMGQQFLTYCLMPWLKRWESEIALKLVDGPGIYAEFNVDGLLRADFATRMSGYAQAIAARVLSPNEARAAENRPPYAEGDTFSNPNITAAPAASPEAA